MFRIKNEIYENEFKHVQTCSITLHQKNVAEYSLFACLDKQKTK